MVKHLVTAIALFITHSVHAELNIPGIPKQILSPLATQDSTLAKTGISVNEDDITASQNIIKIILTEAQLHEAKVWGLTLEEEKRYVFLMQNRSNTYYKGLRQTPLDILGINAQSEIERNHFAELAAIQEAQKVTKNIAWNNAFYKAYNKLFANVPVVGNFDPSPYSPYAHTPLKLQGGETLYFFIKENDAIKTILFMLMEAIERTQDSRLHLMFLDMDDLAIQLWANKQQIPQHLVKGGRITLNHGNLNFNSLKIEKKSLPLLILAKNGSSSLVDLGKF
ncbi:MAG: TIGR03759 family integrating conjugative element protein [Tatlockia sp.]|nr:TIGR03759 family integrating conjugative element protein [Tatlockia sp.]